MSARVPRPPAYMPGQFDGAFWIDEQIWGHRLYDEQTPWLTFLEFMTVFQHDPTLSSSAELKYQPQRQLRLRNIIFNNPHFADVLRDPPLPDAAAWNRWLELMRGNAAQIDSNSLSDLRERIPQFGDFARLVGYLQRTAIEGNSNKRWSSKFVFPFGPNALYEDLRVSESGVSNDRRFFARTGELLYMMLARSRHASRLASLLKDKFLEGCNPTDAVLKVLQGPRQSAPEPRPAGYLPYASLPEYDALAEDWLFLLEQKLPKFDVLPHLIALTGLHLLIYFLRRSSVVAGGRADSSFVCEIVAPRRTAVRDVALRSFENNQALPRVAVENLVRSTADTDEWSRAVTDPEPIRAAAAVLSGRFDWPQDDELDNLSAKTPDQLMAELVTRALSRHKQHVGKIHGSWARNIGLSSRRGSQRVRYAPTDGLLKSLVFANVSARMEYKEFLRRLYERYGFVIGEHQAGPYIERDEADLEDFAENATRLEERLTSLGLMHRLSDGCAYVQPPFHSRSRTHG
jgi:hypothetical protein